MEIMIEIETDIQNCNGIRQIWILKYNANIYSWKYTSNW